MGESKKSRPFKKIKVGVVQFTKDGRRVRKEPTDVTRKPGKRKSA